MSEPDFSAQVKSLARRVRLQLSMEGSTVCKEAYLAAMPLLRWIDYLRNSETTGCCDEFLEGTRAAIVEVMGCLAIGLVRPALFALRGQVDITLSWLYFKDHPIEWAHVEEHGEGFMLKRDVISYLENFSKSFRSRISALTSCKSRMEADPYKTLSAHVHSQSSLVLPAYTDLATLVDSKKAIAEGILLQKEVSEYLGDIILSVFADKWASLPSQIISDAQKRLGKSKVSAIFN